MLCPSSPGDSRNEQQEVSWVMLTCLADGKGIKIEARCSRSPRNPFPLPSHPSPNAGTLRSSTPPRAERRRMTRRRMKTTRVSAAMEKGLRSLGSRSIPLPQPCPNFSGQCAHATFLLMCCRGEEWPWLCSAATLLQEGFAAEVQEGIRYWPSNARQASAILCFLPCRPSQLFSFPCRRRRRGQ